MRPKTLITGATAAVAVLAMSAWAAVGHAARAESRRAAAEMTGGDPDRGLVAVEAYGCGSCHAIPGVRGAAARVGPSLDKVGTRAYVGGVLSDTPDHLVAWLRDPPAADPLTAMPNLHVTEPDARDIAAYLYTLR
ncbi:MAG: cytochrome [Phycisphaerales bacterium]|nr:cytochrome [Phycisphaerales bacterium]